LLSATDTNNTAKALYVNAYGQYDRAIAQKKSVFFGDNALLTHSFTIMALLGHDIIVDNKSATGNNKNILFLPDNKYGLKKSHWGDFSG